MGSRRIFLSLVFISVFFVLGRTTTAARKPYVVYLGSHAHGRQGTLIDFQKAKEFHYEFLGSFLGSKEKAKEAIFYSYNKHINGFAANLEEDEAKRLAKDPDVVSVFLNKARKLHTTRSWNFLGYDINRENSLLQKVGFGDDVIIGTLDTGVWPESESFRDEGMGPIPSKWKGFCQNNTKDGVPCNRKLIGARFFDRGYRAMLADLYKMEAPPSSPRDTVGHGTHTLSTAAGRFVPGANAFGYGNGTAQGGSPNARVAAYKVCWPPIDDGTECCDADILAAFDAAIQDGVDVLSVSIGAGSDDYWMDATAIGAFHAVKNGIVVVCSAGNEGPEEGSVKNVAPWILTVGANTINRAFTNYVELGNKKRFQGQSLSPEVLAVNKQYPLTSSARVNAHNATKEDALSCLVGTLDPEKVKGKIIACLDGTNGRVEKGKVVADAGGVGMIIVNGEGYGDEVSADPHVLPASHLGEADGITIFDYIVEDPNPTAYISSVETVSDIKPAPVMASTSSRGPNPVSPQILKPDVTAPGVNILAAFSQEAVPTDLATDSRRVLFNFVSGTSMSSPHVAGIAGLIKALHPDWSAAAIRSAIMTTARTRDNMEERIRDWTLDAATPFSYGAGHVRVARAMDPGLVYDLTMHDYLNFLCDMGYNETQLRFFIKKHYVCPKAFNTLHFNYPSITVPELSTSETVTRLLKNVGTPGTYTAEIEEPLGVSVTVEPKTLTFDKVGDKRMFWLTLSVKKGALHSKRYVFGKLKWSDGVHHVRSPIVVKVTSVRI